MPRRRRPSCHAMRPSSSGGSWLVGVAWVLTLPLRLLGATGPAATVGVEDLGDDRVAWRPAGLAWPGRSALRAGPSHCGGALIPCRLVHPLGLDEFLAEDGGDEIGFA